MTTVVTFKADDIDLERLKALEEATGLNRSEILRRLIALAHVKDSELVLLEAWENFPDREELRSVARQLKSLAISIESAT